MRGAISPLPPRVFMAQLLIEDRNKFDSSLETLVSLFSPVHAIHNAREQTTFEKLIVAQVLNKFPAFYVTRRFIVVFTRAPQLRSVLSQLRPSVPLITFINFPTKMLHIFLISYLSASVSIILIIVSEVYKLRS